MKLAAGSSDFFVVGLIAFQSAESADGVARTIENLKRKIKAPSHFEFHFSKTKHDWRISFMKEVNGLDFSYYAVVINKAALTGPGFWDKESFYKYACRLVLSNAQAVLHEATVVLDSCGDKHFRRSLSSYLKRQINDPEAPFIKIRTLRTEKSHSNNLLQLADMICGAIHRSMTTKKDADVYRKWIRPREMVVQFWPKEKLRSIP